MKKATSVEEYIEINAHWAEALILLREVILQTELEETLKWSAPVYTLNSKNVMGFGAFKNHFAIWFFNGVFLKDEAKLLVNAQEGKTQALMQMRFNSIGDINVAQVKSYVNEAIENQKLGKVVKPNRTKKTLELPIELITVFKSNTELETCFMALTPGKQREYAEHISSAKREATKMGRLKKITPMILAGKGLYDKYKNC
ncbi:MAG: hypothetical protein BM564_05855 [Bacteroidetes bacterium MedPE-SWsnd-G2]|nr:MAG: hypothetical protein BM564_05855 [Bacteroidetes bacterium MedPE-SWsnd-G2]